MTSESRLPWLMWSGISVLLAGLALAAWALVDKGKRDDLAQAEQRVAQATRSAENQLNRSLQSLDALLQGMNDILNPAMATSALQGPGQPQAFDTAAAERALAALNHRHLEFSNIALVDESGQTRAAAVPAETRQVPGLTPGLIEETLSQALPSLTLSVPSSDSPDPASIIRLLRPLTLPDGRRWVIVVDVPVDQLTDNLTGAAQQQGMSITLERLTGELVASAPPHPARVGHVLGPRLAIERLSGDTALSTDRISGTPALVAARPTLFANLSVAVSLPLSDVMRSGQRDRQRTAWGAAALGLLLLASGAIGHWQTKRLGKARRALAESHSKLNHALAALADGFLLCDAQDRVVLWNERYLVLFPWLRPVIAVGLPYRRLAETAAPMAVPGGGPAEHHAWVEMRVGLHQEANRVWEQAMGPELVVTALERRTPDGGVVSLFHDTTAAERRLAEAKAAAETANEAKSQFLANMSHEIRTPLNALLGLNELMLLSSLDEHQRQHAELMRGAGQLLLALINDILDVSKIEAGQMQLEHRPFSPAQAAEQVVALLMERADQKALALVLKVANDLPTLLLGDPLRVRQVMFNLVGNALKFTDQGLVQIVLEHSPAGEGHVWLLLQVQDTGIGIPPEAQSTLFERFTQVDNSAMRRHGGSGLGLAIARHIVQQMGGSLEVQSQPGQGSRFLARMRCALAPQPAPEPTPTQPAARERNPLQRGSHAPESNAARPARQGLRVLVAEDNEVNQVLIIAILTRMGHQAEIVGDGLAAVQRARDADVDVVLMDMQMPRMDGLSATRAIRELQGAAGRVPIVAMTANARREDRLACLDAGMDGYVSKPIDLETLASALHSVTASPTQAAEPAWG